ncbi:beta-mannosidase [Salipaludibacillus sp. HK11]|uniref:beta-mannosidase n=1 Tax=Salipaludibacillus sp. HK11 TaxID=3394320 RepID=UPI0039FD86C5
MEKLLLNGVWNLRCTTEEEWFEGNVPGSVYHDLLTKNKIEDPFYRDNEDKIKMLSENDYEYHRTFQVTDDLLKNDELELVFEGVDTLSEIYLNDTLIAKTNNMHRTYKLSVKEHLLVGINQIRILLLSPLKFVEKMHKETPIWGVDDAVEGYPHLRKGHSMFGWDWGPQLPDLGVWRDVYVQGRSKAELEDIYISQNHLNDERVDLSVKVQSRKWCDENLLLSTQLYDPRGKLIAEDKRGIVELDGEETITFTVEQPEKWFPVQYGEQPLYKVHVQLVSGNATVDKADYKIGLRTMELVQEEDKWGESFFFRVNGVPVFSKGANYIPEDNLLPRATIDKTERLIQDCVAANFNMIRIWGGGHYPSDEFYQLCDQYGLLVWQDFMFACAVYDLNDNFAETVEAEVRDNVKRIRHHASLSVWCGNNEMEEAWLSWDFPKTEKHKQDYLTLFEKMIPDIVEELDPATAYWPSSPSSGGNFNEPSDENKGDVHYWDVWHGLKPFTDYRKFNFRFVSEFGFQSFPSLKTVETFTEPDDRNIFSHVMEQHQKNGDANGKILYYLAENFQYPKDFDSLLYTSQLLQGEAIKYGVEHWRRNMGRSMGAIYWQLNDCWPVASWASVDYYGRWKALHYFAKRFFSMLLVSAEEHSQGAKIVVTNDHMTSFKGKVLWSLRDADSGIVEEGTMDAIVEPASAQQVIELDFSEKLITYQDQRDHYLEFSLVNDEEQIASQGKVLFVPAKHFNFVKPILSVTTSESDVAYHIHVTSDFFARYVELSCKKMDVVFSDNYFDINKNETVTVTVKKDNTENGVSREELAKEIVVRSLADSYK